MALHHLDDVAQVHERRENLSSNDDVLFDVFEFVGRQRPFLINHRVARSNLAEIVKSARHTNAVHVLFREAHLRREIR